MMNYPAVGAEYMHAAGYAHPAKSSLVADLEKAINGEHEAILTYEKLAQLAPNEDFRRIITGIRNDEIQHIRHFADIYSRLTGGRQPYLAPVTLPTSFRAGVEESFRDELEDSKFYRDVSAATGDLYAQKALMLASHDEQRHASWFLYMLHKLAGR
ncbi:ferritin-like domain-containing protein [Ferviditalea candida]|uniref:Ferritin-like domain-containing protein n=1 Tax=Ferviditalea candida TaxID=3108399 RepID=A0ABU5ZE95_9BACL|nr:ferritin-like domain-containing protein [Paenibacillaceae bacterium T2]